MPALVRILLLQLREHLRTSLWFIPAIAVVLAILLSGIMVELDRRDYLVDAEETRLLFGGSGESAGLVLSTIATAILTVTGVIFSVTMLVLQQASQQLSPRVQRTFLRDPGTQVVLGTYIGTFLYSLLVLRQVRTADGQEAFVPSLSMALGLVLVLTAVALFIYYINHMAQSIRPSTVARRVARETRQAIERAYPGGAGSDPRSPVALPPGRPERIVRRNNEGGVVTAINQSRLASIARGAGCVIEILPMVGDFVREGGEVAHVWAPADEFDDGQILAAIAFDAERSMEQDPAFGLRQLVDIGERALSSGVNDPTTAIQVLDRIHDLLGQLMVTDFPSEYRTDDDGRLMLVLPRPGWDDYVALSLDEIRIYGAGSIQVMRRLRYLMTDLLESAREDRKPPLRRALMVLDATLEAGLAIREDRVTGSRPSPQGHGPA